MERPWFTSWVTRRSAGGISPPVAKKRCRRLEGRKSYVALSGDGSKLAFPVRHEGGTKIWAARRGAPAEVVLDLPPNELLGIRWRLSLSGKYLFSGISVDGTTP